MESYKYALRLFEKYANQSFDTVYLDENVVHKVLRKISDSYSASTWNLYLILYKRLAKFLSDPDDEVLPKFWRKIKPKKLIGKRNLKING